MSDTSDTPTPDTEAPAPVEDGGTVEHTFSGSGAEEAAPEGEHSHDDEDANPEHGSNSEDEMDVTEDDASEGGE